MKASEILAAKARAEQFLALHHRFSYPGTPVDVTDFQLDNFPETGLVAFVLVNNQHYASKWLVLADGQTCPMHFHPLKSEDIAAEVGTIVVRLMGTAHTGENGRLYDSRNRTVTYAINGGENQTVEVDEDGLTLVLDGKDIQRVSVYAGTWHEFWAIGGTALAVEVSTRNSDTDDNVFADEDIGRFADEIEQDVPGVNVDVNPQGFIEITMTSL